ncbi:hypothetical protein [Streptomyces sp. NPDC024089]|uniref:hypothetical protein n=1 Tax=Streptomyces sp. NPDC024089 TaxID=3154328 RepID=UPI0033F6F5B6
MSAPTAPDWPVCTVEAARAAGLDVAPTAAELSAMAASIVRSWGNRWAEPDDVVASTADAGAQLARTVPLILAELDRVRAELAALPAPVVETAFRDALGNLWPVGHLRAADEEHVLKTTPTIQRTVRYGEWTEVTS